MLYRGNHITHSREEILQRVSTFEIYKEISKPRPELEKLVSRIRKVAAIDPNACQAIKKQLPYFTGSCFGSRPRKTENFEQAEHLIIDIDHCFDSKSRTDELRTSLAQDTRLQMMFISPGGMGLKLVYEMDEPCRNTKLFSDAYKTFAWQLARDHSLEGKIDLATHDVTRVCFLSSDPEAYFNPQADKISWKSYLPAGELFVEYTEDRTGDGEYAIEIPTEEPSNRPNDIKPDVYREILARLNPGKRVRPPKNHYVPGILNLVEEPVRKAVGAFHIQVDEIADIQYGKKYRFSHGLHQAELNIYYGKKGFSVVISPRCGTHDDLNRLVHALVSEAIFNTGFRAAAPQKD